MGYSWRGIEVVVYSRDKFRSGAKKGPTLYAVIDSELRHVAGLTAEDMTWPIEVLASVYMIEYLRKTVEPKSVFFSRQLHAKLAYPIELMLIEDEDTFKTAAEAYDLSRT